MSTNYLYEILLQISSHLNTNIKKGLCSDISELKEFDSVNRGYRSDMYVRITSDFFKLHVYDITRLKQDFDSEISIYGYFGIEPNVILVSEVSIVNIKQTIVQLYKQKYFDQKTITQRRYSQVKSNSNLIVFGNALELLMAKIIRKNNNKR